MKKKIRKIFSPLLNMFESGGTEYIYRKSHRNILKILGFLFLILSSGSIYATIKTSQLGGVLPAIVFLLLGFVCEIVAFLGSERAVANIWKST
ncbi:hypothetical protein [Desulfogranum marinum]|uniref:hypothetical protein n=1 Tax=Desulfogranum marinum TaxID=453220 RepID=UPI0019630451|nr:hypothetical protein [Desulfogranum marinum]MBM9514174.1 hypothetical protein [Desulfogranum marinum]